MFLRYAAVFFFGLALVSQGPPAAAGSKEVSFARAPFASEIGDRDVSFLARDLETDTDHVLEGSALGERHTPWSSFKIVNFLIALESGAVPSADAVFPWDSTRRPAAGYWPDAWRQDQSLTSAFKRSAVWFFRDVALKVENQHYRTVLRDWGYGNAIVPDGSDRFWLDGSLRISVAEQVDVLSAIAENRLGVSTGTLDALVHASRAGTAGAVSLHGKTGAGPVVSGQFNGPFEGWYVGFVRRADARPVVFALHTRAPSFRALKDFRKRFAVRLLKHRGLVPADMPD
ncbi:MAG: penicillin-binding transpeptidase domain-containing protein [Pseudomonadota bacterium]